MSASTNRFAPLQNEQGESSLKEQATRVSITDNTDEVMADIPQTGPPAHITMSGLGDTLPRMPSIKEGVIDFFKRMADFGEEQRRVKSRSSTSSTPVGQPIPSAAPPPLDLTRRVDEEFDFRDIVNPRRNRCAIKYEREGRSSEVIGEIFSGVPMGFSTKIYVDGGRYGYPMVHLTVRINKKDKTAPVCKDAKDYYQCDIVWRAGITIDNRRVIQEIGCYRVTDYPNSPIFDSGIMNSCPNDRVQERDQVMAMVLKCNSAKVSAVEEQWFAGLDENVKGGLKAIFLVAGEHRMTFWLKAYPNYEQAYREWASHLESVVNNNIRAFWQYEDENGAPNYSIERNEPIHQFKKSMYVKYHTKKNAQNKVIKVEHGRLLEDKTKIRGYHHFERKFSWESDFEFGVYNAIPVIRQLQFQSAQVAHLATDMQLIYLQGMPAVKFSNTGGGYTPKMLSGVFRAFVRMTTVGATPPASSKIRLEWDNARGDKPHYLAESKKDVWWGTVMKGKEAECRDTGTDFCVWLTMPANGTSPSKNKIYNKADSKLPSDKLLRAHLSIRVDDTSAKREIEGMSKFADPPVNPRLSAVRMALMSDPSRMTHTVTDLTEQNPVKWAEWENTCKEQYVDNQQQFDMLTSVKHVENNNVTIIGPPGSGKTKVLADMVAGLVMCGHTVLVCAVSNNAVDKAANSCWERFPKDERRNYKFLRYETDAAELKAILTRTDYMDPDQDENARPSYKEAARIEDDDVIARAIASAATLQHEHEKQLRAFWRITNDLDQAMEDKAEIDSRKTSNVPSAMTFGNHIFNMTLIDELDASADYDEEQRAYRSERLPADEIEAMRRLGVESYRTDAALAAYAEDQLDEAEIQARIADGRIPSAASRDKSFEYRNALTHYYQVNGQVKWQEKNEFQRLRLPVAIRTVQKVHALFMTSSNAGSELVKLGFSPTVIIIDEAGQLPLAALANVLTSFEHWLALVLLGDPAQLLPCFLSGSANEFRENAVLSALSLLEQKGHPILRLQFQYRMAPAISQWVSKFFYKGLLKDHAAVHVDNDYRIAARQISQEFYGIHGPAGNGSEYWMIDVSNGVSYKQTHGTSLHNYANATVISTLVDQALAKKVPPSKITVLVYYTGQLSVVAHKIEEVAQANGRQWKLDRGYQISSVESFQGEENEFVIVDLVVAHGRKEPRAVPVQAEDSEDDDDREDFIRAGRLTGHVKSSNRLCCALTRGKNGVVVVCQLASIVKSLKDKQLKAKGALGAMVTDFLDRGLVYHNYTTLDTSPIAEEERAHWDKAKLALELKQKEAEGMAFLSNAQNKLRKAQYFDEGDKQRLQIYNSHKGRTTRPNMSGAIAEAAEAHDIESGRNRPALMTEADPVAVKITGQTQRQGKQKKDAKKAQNEAKATKAAEEAEARRKVQKAPEEDKTKGKGKGKGKADETDTTA